jgi:hypothetical protein
MKREPVTTPLDSDWSLAVDDAETGQTDLIGFDYAVLPNGRIKIDCALDCNTASFVDGFGNGRGTFVPPEAEKNLHHLVWQARVWFSENHPGRRVFGGKSIRKMFVALRRDIRNHS